MGWRVVLAWELGSRRKGPLDCFPPSWSCRDSEIHMLIMMTMIMMMVMTMTTMMMMLTMLMLTCRDWSQLGEHQRRLLSQEFSRRSQGHLIEITRSPDGHRNHSYHHNCNHHHKGTWLKVLNVIMILIIITVIKPREATRNQFSCFYRTQVNLGSDLWVRMSVTK